MSTIHIARKHALGGAQARQLASRWADTARQFLGMECVLREDEHGARIGFRRSGVHGELTVSETEFVLEAKLGLLLGAFRNRIHAEITHNLDRLLAHAEPLAAFEHALASRGARMAGPT